MTDILTVVGARPQLVKASVVSRAFEAVGGLTERVVHTGQHYDHNMSQVFFDELGMSAPAENLGISGGSHGEMTARMLVALEDAIERGEPDLVLVYGDTNSTLAGALAATKLGVPVAHVEAGLRSFNRAMPEEINRIAADHVSDWLFAPTEEAVRNLHREGRDEASVHRVGDVMFDVALAYADRADARRDARLGAVSVTSGEYVLATIHRPENTDHPDRLQAIVRGLEGISRYLPVVWPIHPRTSQALARCGIAPPAGEVRIIDPVGYLDMICLERHAAVVATDSGGVQKEAYFHGVPCVTLRDETEWVELVELGWNRLVTPTRASVVEDAVLGAVGASGAVGTPYGDGQASLAIARILGVEVGR